MEGKTKMSTAAAAAIAALDLPFAWAPDMPGCRTVGERTPEEMHVRATELAVSAMEAMTPTQADIDAFNAAQRSEAQAITDAATRAHQERNEASHQDAVKRKEQRISVHEMRNAEASAQAQVRKTERMAAHEAQIEASRKAA